MGSREVVSDEIATKAVFEKFDPDQRKQENGKEELVKAEATKVAPNPVVDEKYAAWCEAVRRAVGELVADMSDIYRTISLHINIGPFLA
jgi:hypothetical protein